MGHNVDAGTDHGDYVTYAQAAWILGVHVSNVPKLVQRGELSSRGRHGVHASLLRADVEQLRERRTELAAGVVRRMAERAARSRTPPDEENEWLTPDQAGRVIGITGQAVRLRCRKETLPSVRKGQRLWIRADHAHTAAVNRERAQRQQ